MLQPRTCRPAAPRASWPLRPLLALALCLMLAAAASVGCQPRGDAGTARAVRVGLYENPPKIYTDAYGRPTGLFIRVLESIARAEQWQLHYQPCLWQQCLEQLASGTLDLMPDVAFSPERIQQLAFHELAVTNGWSQVYTSESVSVHLLDDLADKRIALLSGGVQETFFAHLMGASGLNYHPVPVSSLAQGYQAVATGDADAVVTNSFFAATNAHRYRLRETPIVFLPSALYFATARDRNADLRAAIDRHLRVWRQDPNSDYFTALREAMVPPPEIRTPGWVWQTLMVLAAALLVAVGLALLLRWQVWLRTRDLLATTQALEQQRAAFERLASARGGELQALFDAANAGIVLIEERIIRRCNRHLDELFGYAPGEQIGQSTRIWYPDAASFVRTGQEIYAALTQGVQHPRDLQLRRKNGELFWARLSGRSLDPTRPRAAMVGIVEDITQEHQAAAALRLAHQEQEAILASASVGIILMKERVMVRCNRRFEEMLGYAPGELVGRSTRLWYPDDASWEQVGREGYVAVWRGATDVREQRILRKDGGIFWARMSARAVNPDDPSKGTVAIIQDIEVERAAMAELARAKTLAEDAARAKAEFLANMSHEIRTPMNAILGMQYLALKQPLPAGVRYHLEKAQGAAHALLGLLNDILDVSKIEAGKIRLEEVEFGLDTVVERLTDAIGYQAEQKGIEFLIRYDPAIPPVLIGDPLRLGQVLLNLCGNAVKFTENGEVELCFRALRADDQTIDIQICVRDSGIGMPPAVQAKLFRQFEQGDRSTTRRFGGSGLGLVISKQLIELMQGRIWVEESVPGRGTTLCCKVRLRPAHESLRHREALLDQARPQLSGVRLLVVDDNAAAREILRDMLSLLPVRVDSLASGQAALQAVQTAEPPYDLVLMDWRMPGMNGDEAARRIRNDLAPTRRPKILMVTAYGREDVIRLAERAGVDGFLIKPVSPSTLLDTLLSVLGHARLLRPHDAATPDSLTTTGHDLTGARLLLVEDNAINREFASELLRSQGILVDEVSDGGGALARLCDSTYDAVLMDIQMPIMDGLEATRRIRALAADPAHAHLARLPIIAMTALVMSEDVARAAAAGMSDHIAKPVIPEHLFAVLTRWIQVPPERAGVAPTGMMPSTAAVPADLAALASLDAAAGIKRIGGNLDAYRKQLRRFREQHAGAVVELERLLADGEAAAAQHRLHALKGVAGNLGAVALFAEISALDAELRQGARPTEARLAQLQGLLQAVLDDIDAALTRAARAPAAATATTAPATAVAAADLGERLQALEHALQGDLSAAEPILARLQAAAPEGALSEDLEAIAAALEVFDVDTAIARLAAVRAHWPPSPAPPGAGAD